MPFSDCKAKKKLSLSIFPNSCPSSPPNIYAPGQTVRGELFLCLNKDTKAELLKISFRGIVAASPTRSSLFPQHLLSQQPAPHTITSLAQFRPQAPATCTYCLLDYNLVVWGTEKPWTSSSSSTPFDNNNNNNNSHSFDPRRHSRSSSLASSISRTNLHEAKARALTKVRAMVNFSSSQRSSSKRASSDSTSHLPSTPIPTQLSNASHGHASSTSCISLSNSSPSDYQSGILKKGIHRFEFEFEIPLNLPSSYQADNPRTHQEIRVQYELSAQLHKAAFPLDRRVSTSPLRLIRIEDNQADPFSIPAMRFSEGRSETRREKEMLRSEPLMDPSDLRQKGKGKEKPEISVRAIAERSIVAPGQNLPIRVRIDGLPEYDALSFVQVKLRKLVRYGPPGQSSLYTEDISFAPPPALSRASPNRRSVELVTNLKVPGIYSRHRRRQHPTEEELLSTAYPTPSGLPSSYDSGYFTQISSSPKSTTFTPASKLSTFGDNNDNIYTTEDTHEPAEARGYKVAYPPSVSHGVCPYFSVVYVVRVKIVVTTPDQPTRIPTAKDDGNQTGTSTPTPWKLSTPPDSGSTSPTFSSVSDLSSSCNGGSETSSSPSCGTGMVAECDNDTAVTSTQSDSKTSERTKTEHRQRRWRLSSNGWKEAFRFGNGTQNDHSSRTSTKTTTPSSSQTVELDVGITVGAPRRRIRRGRPRIEKGFGWYDQDKEEEEEEEEEEETDVAIAGPSNPPMLPLLPSW